MISLQLSPKIKYSLAAKKDTEVMKSAATLKNQKALKKIKIAGGKKNRYELLKFVISEGATQDAHVQGDHRSPWHTRWNVIQSLGQKTRIAESRRQSVTTGTEVERL